MYHCTGLQSTAHEWDVNASFLSTRVVITTGTRRLTHGDYQFEYFEPNLSSLSVVAFAGLHGAVIMCDDSLNPGKLQQATATILGMYTYVASNFKTSYSHL